jgi:hypothetical protein
VLAETTFLVCRITAELNLADLSFTFYAPITAERLCSCMRNLSLLDM